MALCATRRYYIGPVNQHNSHRFAPAFTAIVTGGNAGIGYQKALQLARMGARVVIASRSIERGQRAADEISKESCGDVSFIQCDLADSQSIKSFAAKFNEGYDRLDLLINNAGVMAIENRAVTKDGYEMQMGVNHFGHFLLTKLLMDKLQAAGTVDEPARVVNVSSLAHNNLAMYGFPWEDIMLEQPAAYNSWKAYAMSKWSNVLFSRGITDRGHGILVSAACHPGAIYTGLYSHSAETYPTIFKFYNMLPTIFWKDEWHGAQTSLYLSSAPASAVSWGSYYADCAEGRTVWPITQADSDRLWEISESVTA